MCAKVLTNDNLNASLLMDKMTCPCNVHTFDVLDSTNTYAKNLQDISIPALIVANEQTHGRGRLGRSFYSPSAKGIYMTIAFEPNFDTDKIMLVTPLAAVAVCKALEEITGIVPKIKWVNDIYLDGQKVCGILTEAQSDIKAGIINKIIVGIGINCFEQEFPEEIKDRATYIKTPLKEFDRNSLIAAITNQILGSLENFDSENLIKDYKARSLLLGKSILIYGTNQSALPENGGQGIHARAIDIDQNGGLVVEYLEGPKKLQIESITSGEVTIRQTNF
ncbi:MAG: biotin--[Firmicutes bacterium]|nr:biotin--[acetyl-CoA-carboxylase] ligase [Bacillota bacterium]